MTWSSIVFSERLSIAAILFWFGAFQGEAFSERQQALLRALVPSLRQRLILERKLARATLDGAALAVALDAIAQPAFIVAQDGQVRHLNSAGRAYLALDHASFRSELANARAGHRTRLELTAITAQGLPQHHLVVRTVSAIDLGPRVALMAAAIRMSA